MDDASVISCIGDSIPIFGDEIIQKFEDGKGNWEFTIKRVNFLVTVRHEVGQQYCTVSFPCPILDDQMLESLNRLWSDNKFVFGLLSAMSSPVTSFSLIMEANIFKGFHISTRIFPYQQLPSLRELDQAIKSVVSVGALTINFIHANLGEVQIQQQVVEYISQSSPGEHMYG